MTRYILTTATLAAFLASNLTAAAPERAFRELRSRSADLTAPCRDEPTLIAIASRLVAVDLAQGNAPDGMIDVAVQLEPALPLPAAISVWAGIKNGWGSRKERPLLVPEAPGFYSTRIIVPEQLPPGARLWIGLPRDDRRPALGSVPLPGV